MKPTSYKVQFEPDRSSAGAICSQDEVIALMAGPHPNTKADAALIVAAWNAAREINPENPIASAEAMPEIFRLLEAVVVDARKVSHGKLDLEQWLREAEDAIDKAMKEAANEQKA